MIREYRSIELRASKTGRRVEGYAARFNSLSEPISGMFRERVLPQAFKRSLKSGPDIVALLDHDEGKPLARKSAGTLEVREDSKGLWFAIPSMPDTSYANDALVSMRRGDLGSCSFGFVTVRDSWLDETTDDGYPIRELVEVEVYDISIVVYPAYPAATCSVRRGSRRGPDEKWYRNRLRVALALSR
jgi:HK97 family phage prohead protease